MTAGDFPEIVLNSKKAKILTRFRHPWVFSKGLLKRPPLEPGTTVAVKDPEANHLGWAFYHPRNNIALRLVSFGAEPPDGSFWRRRLEDAWQLRRRFLPEGTDAFRWIHGENDGFPGLSVDVYDQLLIVQIATSGFEQQRDQLLDLLRDISKIEVIYEKSDTHARGQEGLEPRVGFVGAKPFSPIFPFREGGVSLQLDTGYIHKTGFYLDQAPQRQWVRRFAKDLDVLDLFCYTGGFAVNALLGGAATVTAVDASADALRQVKEHAALNQVDQARLKTHKADLFAALADKASAFYREAGYDLVVCDPPSMSKQRTNVEKALKGYRRLNRDVAGHVKSGGLLLTFSCTGLVSEKDFQQSVFLGLRDAGKSGRVVSLCHAGADHPWLLDFPEGFYLKGLALVVQDGG
ncbi:class I SAM-dependent rRNA methyltransferase [Acanthopleuribacter pedis]|uniref:Class I SAM-dependent rRNA methyltransferase n=1 Tax=Acanthopleuribacter pedis TaxID=442870 RepID=A0A8J7QC90_9BACT|nr:class I SAM-dependent rRNA methyltransferase [Acanthopleuribacter pedis]MBO1316880.1 class I SAM-dependent rRNA methyltransferase [Acanthopleuribacter pedis]